MKCPNSTIEAPKVKTLAVDPLDPSRSAYIVLPTCDEIRVSGDSFEEPGQLRLSVTDQKIEAVESYPSVQSLDLTNNLIKSFKASGSDLREINLTQNLLTNLDDFDFPMGLTRLILDVNTIQGFTASVFPNTLSEMYLRKNEIQSLATFEFPDKINKLNLNGNLQLTSLKGLVLPAGITEFQCQDSGVTDISGVVFPDKIKTFTVSGKTITSFNVRSSDVSVLSGMSALQAGSATTCAAGSELTELKSGVSACVYDDTSFAIKFPPPNRKKTEAKSSSSSSSSPSTPSASSGGSTNVTDAAATTAPPSAGDNGSSSDGSNSTQMIIVGVLVLVAVIVGVVIGFIVQRRRKARRSENEGDDTKATRATKTAEQTDGGAMATQTLATGFLENDVRNDAALIPYRLPQDEVVIVREIAKGGFGVVFLAKLYSQQVVVKQVSPLKTDSGEILRRFMDEIRLYSRLDHPKIVRFIGLSWTNLLDLSLVMEYMPHGDLYSLLRASRKIPDDKQQFTWFSDHSEPRCKALLALDIAEALVYLHSFNPPIIHRDLKAKNVLLSSDFVAKLGDFGISRETAEETMTGGMGTTAWIAPEVLQGERYSEKADIYSFGILMCEMDTCGHPYNSNRTDEDTLTDAKIAYLVSTASLRPTLGDDCPRAIQKLIFECLDFDSARRPTALELHYNLRKVREASLEWGFV